jgi:hypothetical protein
LILEGSIEQGKEWGEGVGRRRAEEGGRKKESVRRRAEEGGCKKEGVRRRAEEEGCKKEGGRRDDERTMNTVVIPPACIYSSMYLG